MVNAENSRFITSFQVKISILDLSEKDLSEGLKSKGSLYSKNRDKEGKKMLIFDVKKHVKGKDPMPEMKKFFLYHVERRERYRREKPASKM